jgi:hypothetical protein
MANPLEPSAADPVCAVNDPLSALFAVAMRTAPLASPTDAPDSNNSAPPAPNIFSPADTTTLAALAVSLDPACSTTSPPWRALPPAIDTRPAASMALPVTMTTSPLSRPELLAIDTVPLCPLAAPPDRTATEPPVLSESPAATSTLPA